LIDATYFFLKNTLQSINAMVAVALLLSSTAYDLAEQKLLQAVQLAAPAGFLQVQGLQREHQHDFWHWCCGVGNSAPTPLRTGPKRSCLSGSVLYSSCTHTVDPLLARCSSYKQQCCK
jgi:hypothetical protein